MYSKIIPLRVGGIRPDSIGRKGVHSYPSVWSRRKSGKSLLRLGKKTHATRLKSGLAEKATALVSALEAAAFSGR